MACRLLYEVFKKLSDKRFLNTYFDDRFPGLGEGGYRGWKKTNKPWFPLLKKFTGLDEEKPCKLCKKEIVTPHSPLLFRS